MNKMKTMMVAVCCAATVTVATAHTLGGWAGEWALAERPDRANRVEKTANGLRLDGTITTARFAKESKMYEAKIRCRGRGRLRVFIPEYTYEKESRAHAVAFVMEISPTDGFKEYSDFVEIQSWHPASHLEFCIDAVGDVEIASAALEPVKVAAVAKERPKTVVTVPLAGEPFVFDGVFRRDYWTKWGVSVNNGYRNIFSGGVFARQSELILTADAENLYLAVLHPIPPGGIVCNQTVHDSQVWLDECVELDVNPVAEDLNPRHMYQIVSNFKGVTYDIDNDLAIGQFYKEWTCKGYEAKGARKEKEDPGRDDYVLIIRLPFKSVGIADPTQPFGINLGRGFANPTEFASLQGASFNDPKTLVRCRVQKGAPAISWKINDPDGEGRYQADLSVRGGTIAGSAAVVSKEPSVVKKGTFGGGKDFTGTIDLRDRVLASGVFTAEVKAPDGSVLFAHEMGVDTSNFSPKSARVNSAKKDFKLGIEHYPFQKKINLRWSGMSAADKAALAGAEVKVARPDGKVVTLTKPDISFRESLANVKFDFAADQEGEYSAEARTFDRNGRTLAEGKGSFPVKKLDWVGNDLGKDDVVVAPYVPLTVKDRMVSCLLRDTTFGENGLPASIVAAGGEVLSAPIDLELETDAGVVRPMKTKFKFLRQSGTRIEFAAGVTFPDLHVLLTAWMEYDGVIWYTMKLDPLAPVAVKRLTLRLPYADAKLCHFLCASVRGEQHYLELAKDCPGTGKVWTSTPYRSPKRCSSFMPFVWLGEHRRGLMLFGESDEGWVNDETSECYDIRRGADGKVALDANFISVPTTLEKPRTIRFGLLANPLKPVATGAELNYRWSYSAGCGVCNREAEIIDPFMANKVIGTDPGESWVFYLAGQEYVKGDSEMKYAYNEFASYPRGAYTLSLPHRKYRCFGPDSDSYLPVFFDWTDEFVDLLVWRMDQAFRTTRIDGIYMDNSYLDFVSDEMKTRKLWYVRDDGRIQPGCDILNMREMFKRVSVLAQKYGKRHPRIVIHDTGCQVLPRFTFADVAFGGEMNIPKEGKGDHFSVFYSAWPETMLGVDWGFGRGMLTMLGPQMDSERQARAMYACYRIYDMAFWSNGVNDKVRRTFRKIDTDFGINAPDSSFTMWRYNDFVKVDGAAGDIRASFYSRPGKKLIYMANHEKDARTVRFALGAKGALTDAETGEVIEPNADGGYALSIPGHDLKALVFSGK